MENPRPTKVAVVEEVREKLSSADAVLLTEYRGLKVSELAELRNAMRPAGGEYRIYKNTLVRRAVAELELGIDDETLTGPTALAFISTKADGTPGDLAAVAKTVQDFAKGNPLLVLKGGVLGETVLDADGSEGPRLAPHRQRGVRTPRRCHQQRRPRTGQCGQRRAPEHRVRAAGSDRGRRVRR